MNAYTNNQGKAEKYNMYRTAYNNAMKSKGCTKSVLASACALDSERSFIQCAMSSVKDGVLTHIPCLVSCMRLEKVITCRVVGAVIGMSSHQARAFSKNAVGRTSGLPLYICLLQSILSFS